MQIVNTNISSLNAQRNLSANANNLATALQRLSSGLRINSAKDDAAGLAISARMTGQINGLNQAVRNANDGISLSQTAEGALGTISDSLQRIRELAVQSANASNSASDRASMNNEAAALTAEIDRVAQNTSFNGVKLIDGTFSAQVFQVGANGTANDQVTVSSIASARIGSLVGATVGTSTTLVGAAVNGAGLASGDLSINGFAVGATASDGVSVASNTGSAIAVAAAINSISGQTNVTAAVSATSVTGGSVTVASISAGALTINGVALAAIGSTGSAAGFGANIAAAINAVTNSTGVTATADTSGAVTLTAADGRNINVVDASSNSGLAGNTFAKITLNSTAAAGITIGGTANGASGSGLAAGYHSATQSTTTAVSALNLSTAAGAASAIAVIDAAINTIQSGRAALGAIQNRFSSTISTLQSTSENLSAARSRIQDADFAVETANLTRAQILQQAGTAMLSQANTLPQSVLSLLK